MVTGWDLVSVWRHVEAEYTYSRAISGPCNRVRLTRDDCEWRSVDGNSGEGLRDQESSGDE